MIYNKNKYLLLFFFCTFVLGNENNYSYVNNNNFSIQEAIYIIRNKEGNYNFEYYRYPFFNHDIKSLLKANFEIIKNKDINETEELFYIKDNSSSYIISSTDNTTITKSKIMNEYGLWRIIPRIDTDNKIIYYVQNKKNNKFWELNYKYLQLSKIEDIINTTDIHKFQFIELYKKLQKKKSRILDDEPIDVFIKYIDLSDPDLNRTGIKQIEKDEDNQELRYSVRSVLTNIPWIRKIFILMPNERVKYFKPPEEINKKIIYVKDKDLLGFDSASIYAFLFNLHKMEKFGISDNFIIMDDDYFIGEPLEKEDFFYEENGTVLPALITSDYYEMNKKQLEQKIAIDLKNPKSRDPHSEIGFYIQQSRALYFMYKIFGDDDIRNGKKLVEPAFTHTAIPVRISDIEEIHDYLVKYYENSNKMLTSLVRTNEDLQMHTTYMAYVKNKYDRKVNKISSSFYDLTQTGRLLFRKTQLFVINKSSRKYEKRFYYVEKDILEKLFPTKTKYEIKKENEDIFRKNDYKKSNSDIKNLYLSLTNTIEIENNKKKNLYHNIFLLKKKIKSIISETHELVCNSSDYYILLEKINDLKGFIFWQNIFNLFLIGLLLLYIFNKIRGAAKENDNNKLVKFRKRHYLKEMQ